MLMVSVILALYFLLEIGSIQKFQILLTPTVQQTTA